MKETKAQYKLDRLIELLERNGSTICQSDILLTIVQVLKDLTDELESLSNEVRGYDP